MPAWDLENDGTHGDCCEHCDDDGKRGVRNMWVHFIIQDQLLLLFVFSVLL